ncbi:MAG TPA: hypothetical protein VMT18_10590 [Planctomycetota bacterium]|nr:hypothetical protein [Planctomycetota bacterium]
MASYPKRRGADASNQKKSNSVVWFGVLAVAILAGGALMATLTKKEKEADAARQAEQAKRDSASTPFADLPPEAPPPKRGGGGLDAAAPFGSLDAGNLGSAEAAATWSAAESLAAEAEQHYQDAVEAKTAGDVAALNEAGAAAKAKFNEALEATAQLEEELVAKLGESNSTVRALMGARSTWFTRLDWLLKSTGR